jgi:hypothetical protein
MQRLNDERPGEARAMPVRLHDSDMLRLARLARRRGVRRSALTRQLLRLALDQIEQADRAPPDDPGG